MFQKRYFCLFIIFVLVLIFCYGFSRNQNENFNQQSWTETLKCLKFDNKDVENFRKSLVTQNDIDSMLNNLFRDAKRNGLSEKEIFSCLFFQK